MGKPKPKPPVVVPEVKPEEAKTDTPAEKKEEGADEEMKVDEAEPKKEPVNMDVD